MRMGVWELRRHQRRRRCRRHRRRCLVMTVDETIRTAWQTSHAGMCDDLAGEMQK